MQRAVAWSIKTLSIVGICMSFAVAGSTSSMAMQKCAFGWWKPGDRCLHASGKAVCQFLSYSHESDPAASWKCWDKRGVRLYIKKHPKTGKHMLTYGRGGSRGRKRDPRY